MVCKSRLFARCLLALLALFFPLTAQATFTINNDGTVTDTVTGLIWDRCSYGQNNDATCTGTASIYNWSQALVVAVIANSASHKGHTDWRLPNKNELESLAELSRFTPAIDTDAFPNTASDLYWSSTSFAPDPTLAWYVSYYNGVFAGSDKAESYYVRLVHSGQSFDFFDTQGDFVPTAFSFTAQTGATLSSVATSNTLTVSGINSASTISIVGGTYSINGGAYVSTTGMVTDGQTVTVQQTASASYNTTTTATLAIGGVSGAFNVTTLAIDTIPTVFSFTAETGTALSSVATSNALTVSGINSASAISIVGGTYSINGGAYVSIAGTVTNGQTVTIQQAASASYSTTTIATLTIGGVSGVFNVTTLTVPVSTTSYTAPSTTGSGSISAIFTGGGAGCGYAISQYIPLVGHAASPPAGTAPAGVSFPHGLFDFTTSSCTAGATVTFTLTYQQALPLGAVYWKYGPTAGNISPHWYQLPAVIAGNTATFSITDGGLGDDDLTANGTIVDQGGPGMSSGASPIPTLSEWAFLTLAGLMGLFGIEAKRRRSARRM